MYAKYMCYRKTVEVNGKSVVKDYYVDSADWAQVEEVVQSLEAEGYLLLSPSEERAGEEMLLIRVAERGKYVCAYYDGDEYYLESENGPELNPPMQFGEFAFHSTAEFVDLSLAVEAAKTYYEEGRIDASLNWWKVDSERVDGELRIVKTRVQS